MGDSLRAAHFGDDELRNLITFGVERGMQPLQNRRAFGHGKPRPGAAIEGGACCLNGCARGGDVSHRRKSDLLLRGRIEYWLSVGNLLPASVDIKMFKMSVRDGLHDRPSVKPLAPRWCVLPK